VNYKVPYAVFAVLIMVIVSYSTISDRFNKQEESNIFIDGDFKDWAAVDVYSDEVCVDEYIPDQQIRTYGIDRSGDRTSFFIQTQKPIFPSLGEESSENEALPEISNGLKSSTYIFLDLDKDMTTGYRISWIGAELMIEAKGYDGEVNEQSVNKYVNPDNQDDWNSWERITTPLVAVNNHRMEVQIPNNQFFMGDAENYHAVFLVRDGAGKDDLSNRVISPCEKFLRISESYVGSDIIDIDTEKNTLLKIGISSGSEPTVIESMDIEITGTIDQKDISRIILSVDSNGNGLSDSFDKSICSSNTISSRNLRFNVYQEILPDSEVTYFVSLELEPHFSIQKTVGMELSKIFMEEGSYVIDPQWVSSPDRQKSYLKSASPNPIVDGGFFEWNDEYQDQDMLMDPIREDLDITQYDWGRDHSNLFFYMKVDQTMLGGVNVPITPEPFIPESEVVEHNGKSTFNDSDGDRYPDDTDPNPNDYDNDGLDDDIDTDDDRIGFTFALMGWGLSTYASQRPNDTVNKGLSALGFGLAAFGLGYSLLSQTELDKTHFFIGHIDEMISTFFFAGALSQAVTSLNS